MHSTIGARYASGFVPTFATGSFSIGAGVIYDEDRKHSIDTKTSLRVWAKSSPVSPFMKATAPWTLPYYYADGALYYDNAGTMTTVGAAKYVCNYFRDLQHQ